MSAALPILARGSELSFRLNDEGPLLMGRIADASLWEHENARRIEVDVDVVEQEGVRFRRNARYGFPSEIEHAEQASSAPTAPAIDAPLEPRARRTSDRASAAQTFALLPLALSIAVRLDGRLRGSGECRRGRSRRPACDRGLRHPRNPLLSR